MRTLIIPLFAKKLHPSVPLGRGPAGARSEGQGRPQAGASRAPFAEASTLAGWRRSGGGLAAMLAVWLALAPGAMSATALAQGAPAERAAARHPYAAHVADAARRFDIPEAWIWAVMRVESNGDSRAVSKVGAMGLMQVIPGTWAGLRARYGLGVDPYDVRDNIMAGAAYLREMHDRYGDVTAMLAAYNAGPGRYDDYLSRGRPLPTETLAYLEKLAPLVGSSGDVQLASATPPDPFAWRRAGLFVRTASIAESVNAAPADGNAAAAEPTAAAPIERTSSDRETPADTLFVGHAGAARPR